MHKDRVPQVFQDGARPFDVAQVAVLLGWTKDAVRAACERGDLAHQRDHLNAYRIPCSAVLAAAKGLGHKTCRLRGFVSPRFKIEWYQDARGDAPVHRWLTEELSEEPGKKRP